MSQLNPSQWDALEQAVLDNEGTMHDGYSGRGMFQRTCIGFSVDSLRDAVKVLTQLGATDLGDEMTQELAIDLAADFCYDSLGTRKIVYFPSFTRESE